MFWRYLWPELLHKLFLRQRQMLKRCLRPVEAAGVIENGGVAACFHVVEDGPDGRLDLSIAGMVAGGQGGMDGIGRI